MKETSNYLFVYGTLLDKRNEFSLYLNKHCRFYNNGRFKGRLYDIGEYPGAIANNNYPGYIYGSVVLINNLVKVLKQLDNYEGFGDNQQQPNLFVRELIEVETDKGFIKCWVYLYNLPLDGLRLIESGDYLEYKS
jgi:gamma-glutamylcyclotransferase (GGCT)/AIG2-like uncharacterized protein YtfP